MSDLRDFSAFACPFCGHNKVWHYGAQGQCEARVVPDDGCYDYASLNKCGCTGAGSVAAEIEPIFHFEED